MNRFCCQSWFIALLFGAVVVTSEASGQGAAGVALGVAAPTAGLGRYRYPGPVLSAYGISGNNESLFRWKLSGEAVWLAARHATTDQLSADKDLRILSILGSVLIEPVRGSVTPYLSLGVGIQHLTIKDTMNPYGNVPGVRASVGIASKWRGRIVRADLAAHAILSDFGTGRDSTLGTYLPFAVGIEF